MTVKQQEKKEEYKNYLIASILVFLLLFLVLFLPGYIQRPVLVYKLFFLALVGCILFSYLYLKKYQQVSIIEEKKRRVYAAAIALLIALWLSAGTEIIFIGAITFAAGIFLFFLFDYLEARKIISLKRYKYLPFLIVALVFFYFLGVLVFVPDSCVYAKYWDLPRPVKTSFGTFFSQPPCAPLPINLSSLFTYPLLGMLTLMALVVFLFLLLSPVFLIGVLEILFFGTLGLLTLIFLLLYFILLGPLWAAYHLSLQGMLIFWVITALLAVLLLKYIPPKQKKKTKN